MDAPLILTVNIDGEELNDEVQDMEVIGSYGLDFYERTNQYASASEAQVETVKMRMQEKEPFGNMLFTHMCSYNAIAEAPHKSMYTKLNSMKDKIDAQFRLMDMLYSVDRADSSLKSL